MDLTILFPIERNWIAKKEFFKYLINDNKNRGQIPGGFFFTTFGKINIACWLLHLVGVTLMDEFVVSVPSTTQLVLKGSVAGASF